MLRRSTKMRKKSLISQSFLVHIDKMTFLTLRPRTVRCGNILLDSFIFIPPPLERSRKADAKLGVLEKSGYPKFGTKEHG
ncbi:hypothetical protein H5410_004304 [Solanum commersonii]|uniref:Uncharacterized protein n=1 Tax=Solanum commersonii TaxID=4109 RepID=A0A9J6B7L6_SOLCO|nr:hypothetical protein H5410_004304 [Solanum commersonii]